jgi:hypothetical protein
MASEISLGHFTGDSTGPLVQWAGGYGTIWFGWKNGTQERYEFGTATCSIEISDANAVNGVRPLLHGTAPVAATQRTQLSLYLPPCWLRAKVVGVVAGCNLEVRVVPRTD